MSTTDNSVKMCCKNMFMTFTMLLNLSRVRETTKTVSTPSVKTSIKLSALIMEFMHKISPGQHKTQHLSLINSLEGVAAIIIIL
ncbi:hypothetical protein MAR_001349 [Mya arenaria]|uniref:Uncharacterized protein n=1 Tax=Mya arenaria TaxID=6604 RepID=A0ABY7FJT6_MYAAR|nr:hypothetical protein MAR_009279 [Mya arenaria]WAR19511.1 hypothetical protein MAR_001349 [Mya arenaria]